MLRVRKVYKVDEDGKEYEDLDVVNDCNFDNNFTVDMLEEVKKRLCKKQPYTSLPKALRRILDRITEEPYIDRGNLEFLLFSLSGREWSKNLQEWINLQKEVLENHYKKEEKIKEKLISNIDEISQ